MTGFKFEKALKLLVSYLPEKPMKKPTLFHSVRVGTFLWNNGYSEDLQIAGLLHDALEDTDMPEKLILNNFGKNVLEIVQSNSKDNNLESSEILEDIVVRCKNYGEEAMIVKMADVYDNFIFYVQHKNNPEIKRCKTLVTLIEKYKPEDWNDTIFKKLVEINNYSYMDMNQKSFEFLDRVDRKNNLKI